MLKGFCLAITQAACIGGTGSLIGTVPNILFKDYFDKEHPDGGVSFLTFMIFSLPISVIMTVIAWIFLSIVWLPGGYDIFILFIKYK